jgi:hypothetical protein
MSKPDTVHDLKPPRYGGHGATLRETCLSEDLSLSLPFEASCAGLSLHFDPDYLPGDPCTGACSIDMGSFIYLKDRSGEILQEWSRVPSLTEVREAAERYLISREIKGVARC